MGAVTTLSSKFQISIPKDIWEKQGWKPGQELAFVPKGKGVMLVPVPELEDLLGIAPNAERSGYRDRNDRY
jgi:AbrB family looped-hinge helix DNA binding protein